jgi:succinate-semialdehyde dehydrogenase / glutarate-semialdehyde dehydrogenase
LDGGRWRKSSDGARFIDFGMIGLNRGLVSDPAAAFGGMKQSGLGREGAHEGMMEFLESHYVSVVW